MPIRAITFDFWCTLFRDRKNSPPRQKIRVDAFAEATGADPERIVEALKAANHEFNRVHREEHRTLDPCHAVDMACRALDVSLSDAEANRMAHVFGTAILEYPAEPIDGALDAVKAASDHVPVAIVSDSGMSPGSSLRELLVRNGFADHFGAMMFSDEVGVSKPHARMFDGAADSLGVRTDELLHLGDLEHTDIAGAQALRAAAGLFTGENDQHLDATSADYTFTSWSEFVEALPRVLA
ncbi:MAG: HAD family hydrolase [bacterium]|nr:HAD family hydrolase [bacterium]